MRRATADTPYYFGVDGMRFIAALMVAVFHLSWHREGVSGTAPFGWVGVQIFFVISGFVIANSANNKSTIQFVTSRVLRLYPAAFVCAVVGFPIVLLSTESLPDSLHRFVDSFALWIQGPWQASAYWTLPIELSFYALIGCLLFKQMFSKLETLACWLAFVSAVYLVVLGAHWSGLLRVDGIDFEYGPRNMLLLRHGVFFSLGMFLWLYFRGRLTKAGLWMACVASVGSLIEIACRAAELGRGFSEPIPFVNLFTYSALVWIASATAIVMLIRYNDEVNRIRPAGLRALRALGLVTYPFYLLHEVVGLPTVRRLLSFGLDFSMAAIVTLAAVFATSVFVATVAEPRVRQQLRRLLTYIEQRYIGSRPSLRPIYRVGGSIASSHLTPSNPR